MFSRIDQFNLKSGALSTGNTETPEADMRPAMGLTLVEELGSDATTAKVCAKLSADDGPTGSKRGK